ncbi:MAG: GGDEF domain-containing protein, partial [Rubripirellula sp.]|nr:GGDEF domain-containing protein [Rubripirellula sp.]
VEMILLSLVSLALGVGIGFIARQFTAGTSSSDLRPSSELETQLSKLETQLVDAQQRLSRQSQQIHEYLTEARTDELTGLPNRRAIERIAKQELSGDSSTSTTTILAIVDIDHFKKVNDIYGHAAGDATLRFVANQLQQELSPHATVARFGGEEFLILMRSSMNDSTGQLEKARAKISEEPVKYEHQQISVTISGGVSQMSQSSGFPAAMQRADQALYRAKQSGRNCIFFHDDNHVAKV